MDAQKEKSSLRDPATFYEHCGFKGNEGVDGRKYFEPTRESIQALFSKPAHPLFQMKEVPFQESEYSIIDRKTGEISGAAGAGDLPAGSFRIRDFSEETRERLTEAMDRSGRIRTSAGTWQASDGEAWYEKIGAGRLAGALEEFALAAEETNRVSRTQADRIFGEAASIDAAHAGSLESLLSEAERIRAVLAGISGQ